MILTGKCRDEFLDWSFKNVSMVFNGCPESVEHALIIDFFDSVGIYVITSYGVISNSWMFSVKKETGNFYSSRTQATTEAIKKANEIFNSRT